MELAFLSTVSRGKIPIATSKDIQLDCVDRHLDTQSRHGATMQVHRGTWKGRKVAFKYILRGWFSDGSDSSESIDGGNRAYRQDMYDLNFEVQIMSKPTLRSHPNITQLLAVCFSNASATAAFVEPGLIVELAHEQFPDLGLFFDVDNNPSRPHHLPFSTAASLICDIADGIQVLHDHDLIHADIKPGNVLLFPSTTSPCGLVAKIADFGFVGMTTYTARGVRAPLPQSRPRGGTAEWNAPECLLVSDPITGPGARYTLDYPQYKPGRDIYAFGLLATYIVLDGQSPKQFVDGDLTDVKLADKMLDTAVIAIAKHHSKAQEEAEGERSLKSTALAIARATLRLDPQLRSDSLRSLGLRVLLFNDTASLTIWPTKMFVLAHNLFPGGAHEFRCSGLYDAYWASPAGFRERVYASFVKLSEGSGGMLGQAVDRGVWEALGRRE